MWKSDIADKMKRSFFQAAIVSILLYGCTTWTLTIRLKKKLDGNYTRMLKAILNTSWQQHPTRHQLYGHVPPITKTIKVRRPRHAGYCWRSKDELLSDELLWTPAYGQAKAGRPAQTYILQLCEDTGSSPEDLPKALKDMNGLRERFSDIRASGMTWRWWMIYIYIYIYIYISLIILLCVYIYIYKHKSRSVGKEKFTPSDSLLILEKCFELILPIFSMCLYIYQFIKKRLS